MKHKIYPIDWREQQTQLEPYLQDRGGMVRIEVNETLSAATVFTKIIRSKMAQSEYQRRKVRSLLINNDDPSTRYINDVIVKFEDFFEIQHQNQGIQTIGPGSEVASNLDAQTITIINSFNTGDRGYRKAVIQKERTHRILHEFNERIKRERIVLILYFSHQMNKALRHWFWNDLWYAGLEDLTEIGFLLIDVLDPTRSNTIPSLALPTPDCVVRLPTKYESSSRADAIDDLTQLIMDNMTNKDTNRALYGASAFLAGCTDNPANVYNQLAAMIHDIQNLESS